MRDVTPTLTCSVSPMLDRLDAAGVGHGALENEPRIHARYRHAARRVGVVTGQRVIELVARVVEGDCGREKPALSRYRNFDRRGRVEAPPGYARIAVELHGFGIDPELDRR